MLSYMKMWIPLRLTLTTLWADSADDKLVIFFLFFFLENGI